MVDWIDVLEIDLLHMHNCNLRILQFLYYSFLINVMFSVLRWRVKILHMYRIVVFLGTEVFSSFRRFQEGKLCWYIPPIIHVWFMAKWSNALRHAA